MSYTLFLLLNVNHDKQDLINHISENLEKTGEESFCLDQAPDIFFTVDYLKEDKDTSLCIDIPFGCEEAGLKEVLDFITEVDKKVQVQVLDPQLGKMLKPDEAGEIIEKWRALNVEALRNYADGHHFVRDVQIRDGKKIMIEAIRFQEETWQNYCSVALAFARVGMANDARTLFERALEMDPTNSEVMYALGVTHFNLKDYSKAQQLLTSVLHRHPENKAARDLLHDCELKTASN